MSPVPLAAVATVCLAIANVIPIIMIVFGALNLHNCRVEPYIPIWLVVMGSVTVFKSLLNCLYRAKRRYVNEEEQQVCCSADYRMTSRVGNSNAIYQIITRCPYLQADPHANVKPNPCDGLISCFALVWFICGE